MTKVTKVELSSSTFTAIVSLSDESKHLLGFDSVKAATPDIIRDSKDGSLAEYLLSVPAAFRDDPEDIQNALDGADDFKVIFEAA